MKKHLAVASLHRSTDESTVDRSKTASPTPFANDPLRDALSAICRDVLAGAVDGKLDRFLADLVEQHEQVDVLSRRLATAEEALRSEFSRDLAGIQEHVRTEWNELSNQNTALLRNEIVAETQGRTRDIESVRNQLDQALSSLMDDRMHDVTKQWEARSQDIRTAFSEELNRVTAQLSKQLAAQTEVINLLRHQANAAVAEIAQLRTASANDNEPSQLSPFRRVFRQALQSVVRFRDNTLSAILPNKTG